MSNVQSFIAKFSYKRDCFYVCAVFLRKVVFKYVRCMLRPPFGYWVCSAWIQASRSCGELIDCFLDAVTRSWLMCAESLMFHPEIFCTLFSEQELGSPACASSNSSCREALLEALPRLCSKIRICRGALLEALPRLWSMCDQCLQLGFSVFLQCAIVSLWRPPRDKQLSSWLIECLRNFVNEYSSNWTIAVD